MIETGNLQKRRRYERRILLVDDDPTSLFILEAIFQGEGVPTESASDGVQAVEAARRQSFGLVLMDLNMPRMGGIDASVAILDEARERGEPAPAIVAVTANTTARARQDCLAAGMVDFIEKPISLDHLVATVSRYIGTLPVQNP